TVEQDLILLVAAAIDGHARRATDVERAQVAPGAGLDHAGRGPGDLERVTALSGNVVDQLIREGLAAAGRLGLQRRDGCGDGDGIGNGAELQLDVDACLVQTFEDDVLPHELLEARLLDTHYVSPGREERSQVTARL